MPIYLKVYMIPCGWWMAIQVSYNRAVGITQYGEKNYLAFVTTDALDDWPSDSVARVDESSLNVIYHSRTDEINLVDARVKRRQSGIYELYLS